MNTFKIFVLFCFLYINGFSQSFAPIGAKWYYGHRENPLGSPAEGYLLFEVTGDTTINTISCKIITKTIVNSDSSINNADTIYLYKSNANKVFYFNNGQFELIYDFNLTAGDTLKIKEPYYSGNNPDSLIKYIVDSTGTELISGIQHNVIYLHDQNNFWDIFSPIVEDIGSLQYFFPQNSFDCDVANCYTFRCYIDSLINYHISSQSCDTLVSNIQNINLNNFKILSYPNPATDNLTVETTNNQLQITNVVILDITGKQVKSLKFKGQSKNYNINVEDLPTGLYFVKIETGKGSVVKKFVKQ